MVGLSLSACQEHSAKTKQTDIQQSDKNQISPQQPVDQPSPTDALKALDQSLSPVAKTLTANDVKFETYAYEYELPESMKQACLLESQNPTTPADKTDDFCTQIDIHLAKIEPKWIEQVVNQSITNDDNPKRLKFKQTVDDFVSEHLVYLQESIQNTKELNEELYYPPAYTWYEQPKLLSPFNNVVQIMVDSQMYMGGAHGMENSTYLIFDMDLQSRIQLSDIILKEKENDFFDVAHEAFKNYLKTQLELKSEKQIKEYEQTWAFELPENFYFDQKGLVLIYQPYQMGSYAQGQIELVLAYDALTDKLKPQYLPK